MVPHEFVVHDGSLRRVSERALRTNFADLKALTEWHACANAAIKTDDTDS
jgi:hypothetical protein